MRANENHRVDKARVAHAGQRDQQFSCKIELLRLVRVSFGHGLSMGAGGFGRKAGLPGARGFLAGM
jgi:hypothetical protein